MKKPILWKSSDTDTTITTLDTDIMMPDSEGEGGDSRGVCAKYFFCYSLYWARAIAGFTTVGY